MKSSNKSKKSKRRINSNDRHINNEINNESDNDINNNDNDNDNNISDDNKNENIRKKRLLKHSLHKKSHSVIHSPNKEHYLKYLNEPIFQELIIGLKEKIEKTRIEKVGKIIEKLADLIETDISSEFYNYFFAFKKPLNLSFKKRKHKLDSLLKKCKGKFFKTLQKTFIMIYKMNKVKATINRNFYILVKMEEENIYNFFFKKIPQTFAASVNIELNKKYLNKSINEIYKDFNMYPSSSSIAFDNIIEILYEEEKRYFNRIMYSNYSSLYYEYIRSNLFDFNLNEIRKKEGEKYSYLFKYISFVFIKYFQLNRSSSGKKKE